MSADEIFVLALVIGSVMAVVGMAVQSRRAKSSSPTTAKDVSSAEEPAPPAPRQTTPDRRKR
jgi:hypothetical protein